MAVILLHLSVDRLYTGYYLCPDVTLIQSVGLLILVVLVEPKPLHVQHARGRSEVNITYSSDYTPLCSMDSTPTSLSLGSTIVSLENFTRTKLDMLERRSLYSCLNV